MIARGIYLCGILGCFILAGCNASKIIDDSLYITQCISLPSSNSGSKLFTTQINENISKCHALLWRIPSSYEPKAKSAPIADEITIRAKPPELTPGKQLPSGVFGDHRYDIRLMRAWGSFEKMQKQTLFVAAKGVFHLKKVNTEFHGLEVYDSEELRLNGHGHEIWFNPKGTWNFIVYCLAEPEYTYKTLPENHRCQVQSDIDGRIYAKYTIEYSQLSEINKITASVSRLARSFMLN